MKMKNRIDLTGKRFGKLTAVKKTRNKAKEVCWECKCDCGNILIIRVYDILNAHTKSCGCLKEYTIKTASVTHGLYGHPFYLIWSHIIQRCTNPKVHNFKNYGGRGIKVCKRWLKFENFFIDKFHTWQEGLSIDRINNNGNYTQKNTRWATITDQAKNKRNVKKIKNSLGQVFESQADAGRKTHISKGNIWSCLKKKREYAGKDKNGNKIYWYYC